jgi:5,10-methylenetetrahydrofolate reductase
MKLSALATASRLVEDGVEPILQMTTRDRNRIGLQSDMLGAALLGVENLVCMGGDPPHLGDHPDAKPVFDLATNELILAASAMNDGHDLMGNPLSGIPKFHLGAVVNPGADDLDLEIKRLEEKVEAGATFFQTQAIYDTDAFNHFLDRVQHLPIHLLAGILPIKSIKMAQYMNENIPGIQIPDHMITSISESEDTKATSISIAATTIRTIRDRCSGIHMMAMGLEDRIPLILEEAG